MKKFIVLASIFVCLSVNKQATSAENLNLITSSSIPPYVIIEQKRGIVVDIIKAALSYNDYNINFSFAPNKRLERSLNLSSIDGAFNLSFARKENLFYSDPIIWYQNVAVALKSKNFEIRNLQDIADKKIIAFQNASKILGVEFNEISKVSPDYYEVPFQDSQLHLLFRERTDLIVLDQKIFIYYLQKMKLTNPFLPAYDVFPITPPVPRHAVFKSEKVRDDFNNGLAILHQNGHYYVILQRYLEVN